MYYSQFLCECLRAPSLTKVTKHMCNDREHVRIRNIIHTQMVFKARWCFSPSSYFVCPVNEGHMTDPTTQLELMWTVYFSLIDTIEDHTLRGPSDFLYKSKFEIVTFLSLRKQYFIQQ